MKSLAPWPPYKLTLWKLSDPSLIGNDGGDLEASDLLRIFRRNRAKAKALNEAFPVSLTSTGLHLCQNRTYLFKPLSLVLMV